MKSFICETFYKNQNHPIASPWVNGLMRAVALVITVAVLMAPAAVTVFPRMRGWVTGEVKSVVFSFEGGMSEENFINENVVYPLDWWDWSWPHRVPITIQEQSGRTLTDFQVLVILDTAPIISSGKMRDDGGDIRFIYKGDGGFAEVSYWIESGINTPQTSVWLKVPEIPASENVTIYMYYGNLRAESKANFDNTFTKDFGDEGLAGVWHFDEGYGNDAQDSSGSGNDGVVYGASWAELDGGQWGVREDVRFSTGSYLSFDGINDYVEVPYSSSMSVSDFSVEFWIKLDRDSTTFFTDGNSYEVESPTTLIANKWYHLVVIRGGSRVRMYINNGTPDNEVSLDDPNLDDFDDRPFSKTIWSKYDYGSLYIGCQLDDYGNRTKFLRSAIDEFRWYNRALSEGEVRAHFERRKYADPEPAVLIGEEETILLQATIDIDPDTLNLRSQGRWITAYIELPAGYDVEDIDVSSILLENTVPAEPTPTEICDYDNDGVLELMVKFDRAAAQAPLSVGEATLTITGTVNGVPFKGSDTIRVIDQGEGGPEESAGGPQSNTFTFNIQLPGQTGDPHRKRNEGSNDGEPPERQGHPLTNQPGHEQDDCVHGGQQEVQGENIAD